MSKPSGVGPSTSGSVDPFAWWRAVGAYAVDAAQRAVLYADIERQVGDHTGPSVRPGRRMCCISPQNS